MWCSTPLDSVVLVSGLCLTALYKASETKQTRSFVLLKEIWDFILSISSNQPLIDSMAGGWYFICAKSCPSTSNLLPWSGPLPFAPVHLRSVLVLSCRLSQHVIHHTPLAWPCRTNKVRHTWNLAHTVNLTSRNSTVSEMEKKLWLMSHHGVKWWETCMQPRDWRAHSLQPQRWLQHVRESTCEAIVWLGLESSFALMHRIFFSFTFEFARNNYLTHNEPNEILDGWMDAWIFSVMIYFVFCKLAKTIYCRRFVDPSEVEEQGETWKDKHPPERAVKIRLCIVKRGKYSRMWCRFGPESPLNDQDTLLCLHAKIVQTEIPFLIIDLFFKMGHFYIRLTFSFKD